VLLLMLRFLGTPMPPWFFTLPVEGRAVACREAGRCLACLRFGVWGFRLRVTGYGLRVTNLRSRVWAFGFRVGELAFGS